MSPSLHRSSSLSQKCRMISIVTDCTTLVEEKKSGLKCQFGKLKASKGIFVTQGFKAIHYELH